MDGFVVDTGDKEGYLPGSESRLALSVPSIEFIAKHAPEIFEGVSESFIEDKSKANTSVKLLACSQAAWFCIQCVTRSAQGLKISILELNTAVHSVCALVPHIFPRMEQTIDIEEGIVLCGEDVDILGASLAATDVYPDLTLDRLLSDRQKLTNSDRLGLQLALEAANKFELMSLLPMFGGTESSFYEVLLDAGIRFNPMQARRAVFSKKKQDSANLPPAQVQAA